MGQVTGVKVGESIQVPGVPSCLAIERGGSVPLCELEEKALVAVGAQYTADLLAKRKEQLDAQKKTKPVDAQKKSKPVDAQKKSKPAAG